MKRRYWVLIGLIVIVGFTYFALEYFQPSYAYIPSDNKVEGNVIPNPIVGYDLWGEHISYEEAQKLLKTEEGQQLLSAENGAIEVSHEFLDFGRKQFYAETFQNEEFITDILGILDGPLSLVSFGKALLELGGEGTTNLQVELTRDAMIGDKLFKKGEKIDTGLDVPKGSYAPLGMPMKFADGRIKVGISCAACHATVDHATGLVIEGAPNNDINAGMLLALASNSAAYFTNTDVENIEKYIRDTDREIIGSNGETKHLPDPEALEKAVDTTLLNWPRGNFDSTIDLESNPAQIPDSFTLGDHPYGWSGFAMAGPFKGLSSLNNNVHAQNSDLLAQSEQSAAIFDIDKEVYIGTILQNAPSRKYRYDFASRLKPSEFFAAADPNPWAPGVNEMVNPPQFPYVSLFSPNGTIVSSPGYKVGEQINAMSAYQNSLFPPKQKKNKEKVTLGREVFERAGCISCHSGRAFTNNQIIPIEEVKAEPSRAKALEDTEKFFAESYLYTPDTPVPIPRDAKYVRVPTEHLDKEQIKLALAHGDSEGGYKVKGLIGLKWTAPYLHDGGVAVGLDVEKELGMAGTLMKGIMPDPRNSLTAMVDKELREKVIKANRASKALQDVHVDGSGHEHWVDQSTGFTKEEQDALVEYLLSLDHAPE